MRKQDLIKALAERFPDLNEALITRMCDKILDNIVSALQEGRRVEIRGFGTFFYSTRKARLLRNPNTKTVIELPEKRIPRFKAGRPLSQKINERR